MIALVLAALLVYGPYQATVTRVIDGDTFMAVVPLWPNGMEVQTPVRIAHIDAPELHSRCAAEKALAIEARAVLQELLFNRAVALQNVELDKYGRALADVVVDGQDVATALVEGGLARPYEGGARGSWCDGPENSAPVPGDSGGQAPQ